jgi:diguanylate cyclase (GGDEF)-like protein
VFEDVPTAETWSPTLQQGSPTYEHVLAEAGEKRPDHPAVRDCEVFRKRLGERYYVELIYALTHKRFSAHEAQALWRRLLTHRDNLHALLGRNPGMAVAAVDYLTNVERNFVRPTLIDELKLSRLVESATRDALTGLYDRDALNASLERAFQDGTQPISVIMLDLDHFKNFNDSHGHLAGDRVLTRAAGILRESVRDTDIPVRFGGEELCVVLPGQSLDEAKNVAERLRACIENELQDDGVTASFGVASYPEHADHPLALIGAADTALYVSKRAGRNRVSVCSALLG